MEITVLKTGPLMVNTCIVGIDEKNVFVVDPADCVFSNDRLCVVDFIKHRGLSPLAVILTHGHFDHVSGLKDFRKEFPNVPVLIHKSDKESIGAKSSDLQGQSLRLMGFEEFLPMVDKLPEPDGLLEDGKTLGTDPCFSNLSENIRENLNKWKTIHTPGHTSGSICLFNEENKTLISGDTIFYHSWGRTDLPFGDEDAMERSLRNIYGSVPSDTIVYPGHDKYGFLISENLH